MDPRRAYLTVTQSYVIVHDKRKAKYRPYVLENYQQKIILYSDTFKFISERVRNFIKDYNLFKENERVVIGFSGGKDSVFLLNLLEPIFLEKNIEVHVVNIDIRPNSCNIWNRKEFLEIFNFYKTNFNNYIFKRIVFGKFITRKTPCFQCSILRRKLLVDYCYKNDIKKIVFAHNLDDLIETVIIMLAKGKKIKLMKPIRYLPAREIEIQGKKIFLNEIYIVKPLLLIPEKLILKVIKEFNLPYFEDKKYCKYSSLYDKTLRGKANKILEILKNTFDEFEEKAFLSLYRTLMEK